MQHRNEAQTRRDLIDPRLVTAGWRVVPAGPTDPARYPGQAVEEWPTDDGPADYALCDRDKLIGIVEAKRESEAVKETLTQAQRYSKGAESQEAIYPDGYRVPFLYSTNGHTVRFRDVRRTDSYSRALAGFHTPAALREKLSRDPDAETAALQAIPFHERIRPYPRDAIAAVEQGVRDQKRNMLVAMATGTGKTLTTVSLVHRMMKAGVARRVLFLVDRRALAAQAVQAFASYEAEPGRKFDQLYEVYSQRMSAGDVEEGAFNPNVPGLNREDAYGLTVGLPPFAEQRRIVEAAEALLARVSTVRGRLERVPKILRRFRQSVLAAACDGRLTADWREAHPDAEPASALLDRITVERRERLGTKHREPGPPDAEARTRSKEERKDRERDEPQ